MDVCCNASTIIVTSQEIPTPPLTTKCGVSNPNGVGIKLQETKDHETQFGKI